MSENGLISTQQPTPFCNPGPAPGTRHNEFTATTILLLAKCDFTAPLGTILHNLAKRDMSLQITYEKKTLLLDIVSRCETNDRK